MLNCWGWTPILHLFHSFLWLTLQSHWNLQNIVFRTKFPLPSDLGSSFCPCFWWQNRKIPFLLFRRRHYEKRNIHNRFFWPPDKICCLAFYGIPSWPTKRLRWCFAVPSVILIQLIQTWRGVVFKLCWICMSWVVGEIGRLEGDWGK